MADAFATNARTPSGPYVNAAVIDLSSADVDLSATPTLAVNVAVGGTLKVDTLGGQTGITLTVAAGTVPIRVTKVYKIGTAATGLTALY